MSSTGSSVLNDTVTPKWSFHLDEFGRAKRLGRGGMGAVYHGVDGDGVDIAVKELNVAKMSLKLIAKEVKVFKQLNHRNIVSYHGFETHQGRHYILMEYAPDGTLLGNLCSQKPGATSPALSDDDIEFLPMRTVVSYTRQILEGLAYLHDDQELVHRDLKPGNILLFENKKRVKIADFGTCKARNATKTGMGTDGYRAPEVYDCSADATLAASDIWSLGCVVVDMLSGGEPPFFWWKESLSIQPIMNGGDSYQRLIDGVSEGLYRRRPDLSGGVASGEEGWGESQGELDLAIDFIRKCFREDPRERPTARSLLEDPFVKLGKGPHQQGERVGGKTLAGGSTPVAGEERKGVPTLPSDPLALDDNVVNQLLDEDIAVHKSVVDTKPNDVLGASIAALAAEVDERRRQQVAPEQPAGTFTTIGTNAILVGGALDAAAQGHGALASQLASAINN